MSPRWRRPRLSVVAVGVLTGVVAGLVVGGLWAMLVAPLRQAFVLTPAGQRGALLLTGSTDQVFGAAALFTGLLIVVAFVGAVAAWQWRAARGPRMVLALLAGVAGAGGAAAAVGAPLARWRWGAPDLATAALTPQDRVVYVTQAPPVFFGDHPLLVLLTFALPAVAATLTYAVCVLTGTDEMERGAGAPSVRSERAAGDPAAGDHAGSDQQQP